MVQYRETVELKVPLFVLRGLVAATCPLNDIETQDGYWAALKWLADRPIYREQCQTDELVEAVYAPDHLVGS
jgi:hypothetical protein